MLVFLVPVRWTPPNLDLDMAMLVLMVRGALLNRKQGRQGQHEQQTHNCKLNELTFTASG